MLFDIHTNEKDMAHMISETRYYNRPPHRRPSVPERNLLAAIFNCVIRDLDKPKETKDANKWFTARSNPEEYGSLAHLCSELDICIRSVRKLYEAGELKIIHRVESA